MQLRIYTDFDGTISERDSLVWLLDHYVGSAWLEIEAQVDEGRLNDEEGLQREIAMLRAPWREAGWTARRRPPPQCSDRPWA